MAYNRRLRMIAILASILLVLIVFYFKYFPTVVNSKVTNILIFSLIFAEIMLFVYGAFVLRSQIDLLYLLPQMLSFVFIVRAIPNLRLLYPPLHDPYFHYVCTLNVLDYGTLDPVLGWWYGMVDIQLHWPDMHLLTTVLTNITNVDVTQVFRFQEPLIGIIFFLGVFLLAKQITKNDAIALLSSLFASLSATIIFYQSEYHPQGFAITIYIYILYLLFVLNSSKKLPFRYLFLIFCFLFTLSHYFSPLFIAILLLLYLVVSVTLQYLIFPIIKKGIFIKYFTAPLILGIRYNIGMTLIVIISTLVYQIVFYDSAIYGFISHVNTDSVLSAGLISLNRPDVPLISSILNTSKWGLFLLAIVSIIWIYQSKDPQEFRLAILFMCIVCAGAVGNYLIASPLDRIIAFYTPIAAIFGSLTLFRIRDLWFAHRSKIWKGILISVFASLLMTTGVFGSQTPAYFFQDSEANTYYWYSNVLPKMEMYKPAGEWSGAYVPVDSFIEVEFDTRVIPFYYGKRSEGIHIPLKDGYYRNFIMINPNVIYSDYEDNKYDLASKLSLIYSNHQIAIIM